MSVEFDDLTVGQGFTMLENAVLLRRDLAPTAKAIYAYLKHLAWTEADPKLAEMAEEMGVSVPTFRAALKELQAAPTLEGRAEAGPCLVEVERAGFGQNNLYRLHRPEPLPVRGGGDDGKDLSLSEKESLPTVERIFPTHHVVQDLEVLKTSAEGQKSSPRRRDLVWDALIEVFGYSQDVLDNDKDVRGRLNKACQSIRRKERGSDDATIAAEVPIRARLYVERWPNVDLTPTALASRWNDVKRPKPRGKVKVAEQLLRSALGDDEYERRRDHELQ